MERLELIHLFVTLIALYVVLHYFRHQRAQRARLPPGPPAWPVIGNLRLLGQVPHRDITRLGRKYGPIMFLRLGSIPLVVVSSPGLAKEVLKAQDEVFGGRPKPISGRILAYGCTDMVWSDMGPYWKFLRKVSQFELFSTTRIASYKNIRLEENLVTLHDILDESNGGAATVDIAKKMEELAINNITRMLMGKKYFGNGAEASPEAYEFASSVRQVLIFGAHVTPGELFPALRWFDIGGHEAKMRKLFLRLDPFVAIIIEEHRKKASLRETKKAPDFVDVLVSLRGEDALTEVQMKAYIQDMILAGTETISNQVMWTMAELMRHPELRTRLQDEIMSVVGPERLVEESDIPNLPYLQAVVKESFRLHPVAPLLIPHESCVDAQLGGYHIPTRTRIFVNQSAIHTDPSIWDRPLGFDPDRFLPKSRESHVLELRGKDFEFLPFGSGRRICPGINLGLIMVHFAVAQLLHTFDWFFPPGQTAEDLDMSESFGMTIAMLHPLKLMVKPRLDPTLLSYNIL